MKRAANGQHTQIQVKGLLKVAKLGVLSSHVAKRVGFPILIAYAPEDFGGSIVVVQRSLMARQGGVRGADIMERYRPALDSWRTCATFSYYI